MRTAPLTLSENTVKSLFFGDLDRDFSHRRTYLLLKYFYEETRAEVALLRDHADLVRGFASVVAEMGGPMTSELVARLMRGVGAHNPGEVIDTLAWFQGRWLVSDALTRLHPEVHWGAVVQGKVRCRRCLKSYLYGLEGVLAEPHEVDDAESRRALPTYLRLYEADVEISQEPILFRDDRFLACADCGQWLNMPRECHGCGANYDAEAYGDDVDAVTWTRCLACGEFLEDALD